MTHTRPPREPTHSYYMRMAHLISTRATCVRRAVGCVITDERNRIVSTGYNGLPGGMPHCNDNHPCEGAECPSGTELDLCLAIHAEVNAISQAESKLPWAHVLYCTTSPCMSCMKLVLTTQIMVVYYEEEYPGFESVRSLWNKLRGDENLIRVPGHVAESAHDGTGM